MASNLRLYGYWRSSATWRVRIALNLKGLACETVPVHLLHEGGQQHRAEFLELNPMAQVPVLLHGDRVLRQSMAIIEYLEDLRPDPPLLRGEARDRARARAMAQLVACEIHPLCNLRVLQHLERAMGVDEAGRVAWMRHWMAEGLAALEAMVLEHPSTGAFCEGDSPGMADCFLVPQLYNARRHGLELDPYPTLLGIEANCNELPEFEAARPEHQPDAA